MKSLLERLQPLKTAIKSIFFISITVLVVIELVEANHYIRIARIGSVRLVYLAPYSHDYNWVSRRTPHVVL